MGIETEYGLRAVMTGDREQVDPEAAAHELFHDVLEYGRSTNAFLANGARLYLDVGAHPEYATAECDNIDDLLAQDRAGDALFVDMINASHARQADYRIHLFKNNVDSAGNSYGCHENYLIRRRRDFRARINSLIPFFVTRQVLVGAGHIRTVGGGKTYEISARSDQVWDAISSATTRSRPIINTRDEPHGNPDKYRRLHVIVGDSNMSEYSTGLKVAATEALLTLVEDGAIMPGVDLVEPMAAIRQISHDLDMASTYELDDGRRLTALQIQRIYAEAALSHYERRGYMSDLDATRKLLLTAWMEIIEALSAGDLDDVAPRVEWVAKRILLERYRSTSGADWDDPRVARLDLAYHDISPDTGLYRRLVASGHLACLTTADQVAAAMTAPPSSTRAAIRGAFVARAAERRRDVLVDWTTLRLMSESGSRTVLLNDPFATDDVEATALMESM